MLVVAAVAAVSVALLAACSPPAVVGLAPSRAPAVPVTTPGPAPTTTSTEPSTVPVPVPLVPVPPPTAPLGAVAGWSGSLSTVPPVGGFTDLSCISDTLCVAAGGGPATGVLGSPIAAPAVTESWDGAIWSPPSPVFAVETGAPALSCAGGPFCAVVDNAGRVTQGDGTDWISPSTLPAPPAPPGPAVVAARAAVTCPSTSFCAIVDSAGHAWAWRGGSWIAAQTLAVTGVPVAGGQVGLDCASTAACTAVVGHSVLDWDGTSWSVEAAPLPLAGAAADVSCPSVSLCVAVGGSQMSYRTGDGPWAAPLSIDPAGDLDAVSCPSTTFCLAADAGGAVTTWGGAGWSPPAKVVPSPAQYPADGTSADCATPSFCLVLNGDGDYATLSTTSTGG